MAAVEKAFLQAILEDPGDDTPRLVYADWLDEHDEPDRAAFIRTQIERAGFPEYEPRWIELRQRERELLDRNQAQWLEPLQVWARPGCVFQRGFVGEVWCSAAEFLKGGKGLLRRAPVQKLALYQAPTRQFIPLVSSSLLELLHTLRTPTYWAPNEEALRALATSPHTANLRCLRLSFLNTSPEVSRIIASAEHLDRLTHLELGGWTALGDSGAAALAAAPFFPNLTSLRLNNNQIGGAGVRALLEAPRKMSLTELGLTVQKIDATAAPVLASLLPSGLRELDLRRNRKLGRAGIEILAATPALSDLAVLRLTDCGFGPGGARALAQSPHLRQIRQLVLCQNPIADEGAQALADSPHLENLTILNLCGCKLSLDAIEALATSARLPRLAYLLVDGNGLDPEAWQALKSRCRPCLLLDGEAFTFAASLGRSMTSSGVVENFPSVWGD